MSRPAHDRPTAAELATAVHEFLEHEILPLLDDHRLRFRTLVAMNALTIVAREAPDAPAPDWATARRIRAGDIRPGDAAALKLDVEAKLRVASPAYLERYR
ncbi:MAG: DUF6285 domain-containing protein [Gaiellaceae bacterium]